MWVPIPPPAATPEPSKRGRKPAKRHIVGEYLSAVVNDGNINVICYFDLKDHFQTFAKQHGRKRMTGEDFHAIIFHTRNMCCRRCFKDFIPDFFEQRDRDFYINAEQLKERLQKYGLYNADIRLVSA